MGESTLDVDQRLDRSVDPGRSVTISLRVDNTGNSPVADLVVVDALPAQLVLDTEASGSGPGRPFRIAYVLPAEVVGPDPSDPSAVVYRDADGALRWSFPGWSLPVGATMTIEFGVVVAAGVAADTAVVNSAAVSSSNPDLACTPDAADDGVVVDGRHGVGRFCTSEATITVEPAVAAAQQLQTQVADWATLQTQLDDCTDTTEVALTADIDTTGEVDRELRVNCVAVLDLAGFDLIVRNVVIASGQTLTIDDSAEDDGMLTADATTTGGLAGIRTSAATLNIAGGRIVARGGNGGAGIGGGGSDDTGGSTTISGGDVTAMGGNFAAGIGGGSDGAGGTITISGGAVTATGGNAGAGIGGGLLGAGGTIRISGGTLIATGGTTVPGSAAAAKAVAVAW